MTERKEGLGARGSGLGDVEQKSLGLGGAEQEPEGFDREWKLVNTTLRSGYPFWDPLPWPPAAPDRGWLSNEASGVEAYLAALGERQRAFEREVLTRLDALERVVRDIDQRTVGSISAR